MKKSWLNLRAVIAHLARRQTSLRRTKPPCVARVNDLPFLTRPYMVAVLPLLTGVQPSQVELRAKFHPIYNQIKLTPLLSAVITQKKLTKAMHGVAKKAHPC